MFRLHRKRRIVIIDGKPVGRFNFREGQFYCHLCNEEKELNGTQLRQHYLKMHPGKFITYRNFSEFVEMKPLCEICYMPVKSLHLLEEHLKSHDYQYKCSEDVFDDCQPGFKSIIEYSLHRYKHDNNYQCQLCNWQSQMVKKWKKPLIEHLSSHSEALKPYLCELEDCNKRFVSYSRFIAHRVIHVGEKEMQCEFCAKTFKRCTSLNRHRQSMHNELLDPSQQFQFKHCEPCKMIFKSRRAYLYHREKHTGNFVCDQCGKICPTKQALRKHRSTHGEKMHPCQFCGKKFATKAYLSEHENIHTGNKPYPCRICGKGFTQAGSRKIHERTHTNEKPFVCKSCNKGYTSGAMLNIHKRECTVGF